LHQSHRMPPSSGVRAARDRSGIQSVACHRSSLTVYIGRGDVPPTAAEAPPVPTPMPAPLIPGSRSLVGRSQGRMSPHPSQVPLHRPPPAGRHATADTRSDPRRSQRRRRAGGAVGLRSALGGRTSDPPDRRAVVAVAGAVEGARRPHHPARGAGGRRPWCSGRPPPRRSGHRCRPVMASPHRPGDRRHGRRGRGIIGAEHHGITYRDTMHAGRPARGDQPTRPAHGQRPGRSPSAHRPTAADRCGSGSGRRIPLGEPGLAPQCLGVQIPTDPRRDARRSLRGTTPLL